MGKYGIGARVRDKDGDEGVIVGKEKGRRMVKLDPPMGFQYWADKSDLTIVEPALPSAEKGEVAFAVGDRVMWADGDVIDDERRPPNSVGVVDGDFNDSIVRVLFEPPFEGWGETGRNWHVKKSDLAPFRLEAGKTYRTRDGRKVGPMRVEDAGEVWTDSAGLTAAFLEPAGEEQYTDDGYWLSGGRNTSEDIIGLWTEPAAESSPAPAATLTIEAGRYYRTRDGRRVGPMEAQSGSVWTFRASGTSDDRNEWATDGHWNYTGHEDNNDLVAEWVEPAVTEPRTRLDLKLGDKVTLGNGKTAAIIRVDGSDWPFQHDGNGGGHWCKANGKSIVGEAEMDIVGLAKPQPKFKVGDVVNYGFDGKPADGWQGTTITSIEEQSLGETLYHGTHPMNGAGAFYESWIWLAPPAPRLPIGTEIILTGRVTGHNQADRNNTQVVIDGLPPGRNSMGVKSSAISAA